MECKNIHVKYAPSRQEGGKTSLTKFQDYCTFFSEESNDLMNLRQFVVLTIHRKLHVLCPQSAGKYVLADCRTQWDVHKDMHLYRLARLPDALSGL